MTVTTPRSGREADGPDGDGADQVGDETEVDKDGGSRLSRALHAHQVHLARLGVVVLLLTAALVSDVVLHARLDGARGSLARERHALAETTREQNATLSALASTTRQRDQRKTVTSHVQSEIATTQQQIGAASHTNALQSLDIASLDTCLNGVTTAANDVVGSNLPGAVASINSVSASLPLTRQFERKRPRLPLRLSGPVRPAGRQRVLHVRHQLGGGQHPDHPVLRPGALDDGRRRAAPPAGVGAAWCDLGTVGPPPWELVRDVLLGGLRQHRRTVHLRGGRHTTARALHRQLPVAHRLSADHGRFDRPEPGGVGGRHAVSGVEVARGQWATGDALGRSS